ncbi:hypothetical protein C8Q72DRAFT_825653 [Fomitopsis betulina]|nr:hypothetical protein C8Q72DRAFT_825653 [Fomitopsis betulina]
MPPGSHRGPGWLRVVLRRLGRTSYTCGGVGHLSRDCVQASRCYNCSGVVRYSPCLLCLLRGVILVVVLNEM